MSARMKYLFSAALILLLDLSTSQEVDVPCKTNADCQNLSNAPSGVFCTDGFCKCKDDLGKPQNCASVIMNNNSDSSSTANSSRAIAGLVGRFCTSEKECGSAETNAHCNLTRKQCQCSTGFVASLDFTKCLPSIGWNNTGCEIPKQCETLTANSTCSEGKCVCPPNLHHDSNACWANREFGANCTVTQECTVVDKAICDSQFRCGCPVNTVVSPDSKSCLSIASKIEDPCVESIQCTQLLGEGGVCVDQLCKCHEHHHYSEFSYKCMKNLGLGDECQNSDQCSDGLKEGGHGPMQCKDNKCQCAEDFKSVDGVMCESVLQQKDDKSSANQLGDVSTFVMTLIGYFVVQLSLVL